MLLNSKYYIVYFKVKVKPAKNLMNVFYKINYLKVLNITNSFLNWILIFNYFIILSNIKYIKLNYKNSFKVIIQHTNLELNNSQSLLFEKSKIVFNKFRFIKHNTFGRSLKSETIIKNNLETDILYILNKCLEK